MSYLLWPFRAALRALSLLSKTTLILLIVLSLTLNFVLPVATVLSGTLFSIAESLASRVTRAPNIAANRVAVATASTLKQLEMQKSLTASVEAAGKAERMAVAKAAEQAKSKARKASQLVANSVRSAAKKITKSTVANVGALFGEAIPYVGAGVVVATTAYEVKTACEMMTDLRDIEDAIVELGGVLTETSTADRDIVCGIDMPTQEEIVASITAAPNKALEGAMNALPKVYWKEGWQDLKSQVPDLQIKDSWNGLLGKMGLNEEAN